MSNRTAAVSTNDQGGPGACNGARQTESARGENAANLTSAHAIDSPRRCQQISQQEIELNYYRKFLEDLVAVVRDAHSDAVARLVSLIRSGASKEDIRLALQRVQDEI
ncbi:hypothetical protein DTO027I6_648 [Penicillium roqueforti]|nr:hypothetical protein CBS147332_2713 [Penicillium roqueforti]KAI3099840.1 hypothetical protein CBS147331_8542 [Penicillium roqueforti]KAI3128788.1 hypothetical protein CBS147330_5276 [Penicillium roqueforti]KAI3221748.1 hypothetical protein DTO027I6_648 [Penicillium roqueforti]KAI3223425.1 hypothetical protein DTO012A7_8290 [Penicillium roqueforti]